VGIAVARVAGGIEEHQGIDAGAHRTARWLVWIPALGGVAVLPFLVAFASSPTVPMRTQTKR
jgi:hypothetical protein